MLEVAKNYDEEEKENDTRRAPEPVNLKYQKMINEMTMFLRNEDNRILCNKIDKNVQLINNTLFYLANEGEDNLEIKRNLNIFDTLKEVLLFEVQEDFIIIFQKY